MDIDNLKSTWQALQTQPEPILENEQIRKLLRGKAKDSISKIKRSILIEGGLAILVSIFFIVNKSWFHSPFIVPYLVTVMLLCMMWYAFMYKKIKKADLQENLKQTLQKLISTLDLYLKVYLYGSLALVLFAAMLPLLWKNVTFADLLLTKSIVIVGVVLIAIPAYYFFTKWYIKNLYGNYVNQLKEELKELEDLEE
jgi:glucan phosphoethanolaminetransferase (alkaline phosphatase superfamily)